MTYKAVIRQNTGSLDDIAYSEVRRYTPKKLAYDRGILKDPHSNSAFKEIELAYKESGRKMEPEYRKLVDILEGKTVEKEKYDSGYRERWSSRLAKFNSEMREIKTEGDYKLSKTQKRELEALLDNNYLKKSISRTKDESRKASLRSLKSHAVRYVGETYSRKKAEYSDVDTVIEQYVKPAKVAEKKAVKAAPKTTAKAKTQKSAKSAAEAKTKSTKSRSARARNYERNSRYSPLPQLPPLSEISDLTSDATIVNPHSVHVEPATNYHAIPTAGTTESVETGKDIPLEVIAASAETGNKAGVKPRFSVRKGLAYAAMFLMLAGAGKSIVAAKVGKTPGQKPAQAQDFKTIDLDCEIKYGKGNPNCIIGKEGTSGESNLITPGGLDKKSAGKTRTDVYRTDDKKQDKPYDPKPKDPQDKDKQIKTEEAPAAATDTVKTDYSPNNTKPKFHARPLEDTLETPQKPRFHAKPAQENIPQPQTSYPIQTQSNDDGTPKVFGATVMPSVSIADSGQPVVGLDVSKKGTGVTVSASPSSGYSEAIAHTNKIGVGMNTNDAVIIEHRGRNLRLTKHDNRDSDLTLQKSIGGFGDVGLTTNGTGYARLFSGAAKVAHSHGDIEIGVNPDLILLQSLGVSIDTNEILGIFQGKMPSFKNLISLGLVEHGKVNNMYNQLMEDRKNKHEYAAQARYTWEKMIFNAWDSGSAESFIKKTPVVGKIYNTVFGGKNKAIKKEAKELRQSVDRLKNRTGNLFDFALAVYADVDLNGANHSLIDRQRNHNAGFDHLGGDIAKKVESDLEKILVDMKNNESCRVDLDKGKIVFVTENSTDAEKKLMSCGEAYKQISAAFAADRKATGNRTAPMDRKTFNELMAAQ